VGAARIWNSGETERGCVIGIARGPGSVSGDASHDDLTNDHKPEPHKGADERWRKSLNGYPLTTGCGDRTLYLEAPNCRWRLESFKPQSRRRPLSLPPHRHGDRVALGPHRTRTASRSRALQNGI